jgi:hypothetical protein
MRSSVGNLSAPTASDIEGPTDLNGVSLCFETEISRCPLKGRGVGSPMSRDDHIDQLVGAHWPHETIITAALVGRQPRPTYRDLVVYIVIQDDRAVGRIYEDRQTLPDLRWFWSVTVYVDPKQGINTSGRAATLDEAKAQFLSNWLRCRTDSTPSGQRSTSLPPCRFVRVPCRRDSSRRVFPQPPRTHLPAGRGGTKSSTMGFRVIARKNGHPAKLYSRSWQQPNGALPPDRRGSLARLSIPLLALQKPG